MTGQGNEGLSEVGSCRKGLGDTRPALLELESTGCEDNRAMGGQTRKETMSEDLEEWGHHAP